MGNEGDRDLALSIFNNPSHHQNPNLHMMNNFQNPNFYEPRGFYNPSLNPNASEFYHDHQIMNLSSNSTITVGSRVANPSDHDHHQTLASAFTRLSLNHQEHSPHAPVGPEPVGPAFGAIARPLPNSPDQDYYSYLLFLQELHKKRVDSAVKGQHAYRNTTVNGNASGSNGNYGISRSTDIPLLNQLPIFNENTFRPSLGKTKVNNVNGSSSSSSSRRDFGGRRGRSMIRASTNSDNSLTVLGSSSMYNPRSRPSYSSLEELKGRIGYAAKEQNGCRFLQKKLEDGNGEEVEIIFVEMVEALQDLIVDQFGNYLIQKLFEVCSEAQITKILYSPAIGNEKKLMAICTNDHGTRAIQKLLEYITTAEQKSVFVSSLIRISLPLMKDQKGHHVIQQCLRLFPLGDVKYLLHQVAENCLDLALDRQGCCVLQLCLSQARGEYLDCLLTEIAANALALSVNCFGNYVLQFVLELEIEEATASIVSQLYGNYVTLSMSKCASNVVEKCLQEAKEDQSTLIIHELLTSPCFLNVCQDSYGNYVVQTALRVSKGDVHKCLANHIVKVLFPFLQSHPHGKNVLQEAKPSKHRGYNKRK